MGINRQQFPYILISTLKKSNWKLTSEKQVVFLLFLARNVSIKNPDTFVCVIPPKKKKKWCKALIKWQRLYSSLTN